MDIILYQYILQDDQEPLQDMLLGEWTQNTLRAMQGLAGTEGCHYFNGGLTPDVAGASPFMVYRSFLDFLQKTLSHKQWYLMQSLLRN
jgi:hypothetical protein